MINVAYNNKVYKTCQEKMVNIFMDDAYASAFYDIVKETQSKTGYDLPLEIESYVVMLLASKIDKPNFLPEKTFAQCYLTLKEHNKYDAKTLGDTCLFVRGVFPNYGRRYGIRKSYYTKIGRSSYEIVSEVLHPELFGQLAKHFDFLGDFISMSIKSNPSFDQKLQ